MKKSNRYFSLDMWRGIAALYVTVFHGGMVAVRATDEAHQPQDIVAKAIYAFINFGWVGVPIFFVISGYCIAAASDNLRTKGHAVSQFFWRRFRRIYPPYWVLLGGAAAAIGIVFLIKPAALSTGRAHLSAFEWLGNITLTQTWLRHFQPHDGPGTVFDGLLLPHAWTLCYEEQFYAVCGLALLLSRKYFFGIVATVTAIVCVIQTPLGVAVQPHLTGSFLDGAWLTFAAGVLIYYVANLATRRQAAALTVILLLTLVWQWYSFYLPTFCGLSFAVLALFLHRWDRPIASNPIARPFMWCGLMCYSIYLIHLPICFGITWYLDRIGFGDPWSTILITVPLCVVATLIAGRIFYLLIERRFLNSGPVGMAAASACNAASETALTAP